MATNKVNLFISSKNRLDGTTSDFLVNIPNGFLKCRKNEEWLMRVSSFNVINNWFHITNNYNNSFQLIVGSETYNFTLNEGSPNIYELLEDLQLKTQGYLTITYDKIKNRFIYNNITNEQNITLIPINSGDFLGFDNMTLNEITSLTISDNPINVQGDRLLFLKLYGGDITLKNNTIDNLYDENYQQSDILFYIPINVPSGSLISYNNEDSGVNFSHKIAQHQDDIDHFSLQIVNEDGKPVIGFSDYYLILQFEKVVNTNFILYDILTVLENIFEYIKWFGNTYYQMIQ